MAGTTGGILVFDLFVWKSAIDDEAMAAAASTTACFGGRVSTPGDGRETERETSRSSPPPC